MLTETLAVLQSRLAALQDHSIGGNSLQDRSVKKNYQRTLDNLRAILDEPDPSINDLKEFFEVNWSFIKGTNLSYTALPNDALTRLLCDIAGYVANIENQRLQNHSKPLNALEILMPGVRVISMDESLTPFASPIWDEAEHCWIQGDIQKLLQTHILVEEECLLPVRMLSLLLEKNSPDGVFLNRYSDCPRFSAPDMNVAEEALDRLKTHSPYTKAMVTAWDRYRDIQHDRRHLEDLFLKLKISIRGYHPKYGGVGAQGSAGFCNYPAVLDFLSYYARLDDENKSRIPKNQQSTINHLSRFYVASKECPLELDAGLLVKACKMSYKVLESNIYRYSDRETLQTIRISEQRRAHLLEDKREDFATFQHALEDAIETGSYTEGHDALPLKYETLKALDLSILIDSPQDLFQFLTFSSEEILELGAPSDVKRQILNQIRSLSDIIMVCHHIKNDRLEAFLTLLADEPMIHELIHDGKGLAALLNSVQPEKVKIFCQSFNNVFFKIAHNMLELSHAVVYLELAQREEVYEWLKDNAQHIPYLNPECLLLVMCQLKPEQRTEDAFFQSIKDKLINHVYYCEGSLIDLFEFFTAEQSREIYEGIKEQLFTLITHPCFCLPNLLKAGQNHTLLIS